MSNGSRFVQCDFFVSDLNYLDLNEQKKMVTVCFRSPLRGRSLWVRRRFGRRFGSGGPAFSGGKDGFALHEEIKVSGRSNRPARCGGAFEI